MGNITKIDLEEQSLKLFKNLYQPEKENILAFSGGKDSIVMYQLAKRTGLKFTYIYTNTTIDPPGHISFIRKNYPDVQILNPKLSFYQLIEKKGLPTRRSRYCCQYLKEYVGKGAKVFEGLRYDEGAIRGARLRKLKEPESCDTRVKGKIHAFPILNWTEKDIWNYIKKYNLPYSDWYSKGFHRLGCVGCPIATQKERIKEYQLYPKYVYAVLKAIKVYMQKEGGLQKHFADEYEAFMWWISGKPIRIFKRQGGLKRNYKEEIETLFPLKPK